MDTIPEWVANWLYNPCDTNTLKQVRGNQWQIFRTYRPKKRIQWQGHKGIWYMINRILSFNAIYSRNFLGKVKSVYICNNAFQVSNSQCSVSQSSVNSYHLLDIFLSMPLCIFMYHYDNYCSAINYVHHRYHTWLNKKQLA